MKVRAMLDQYIASNNLCPGATSVEVWQNKKWLEVSFDNKVVRVFPMFAVRKFFLKHDIHHMLTGYDTTAEGEVELAAWELGSGGCSTHIVFWIDRVVSMLIGLVFYRERTVSAFKAGRNNNNLFSLKVDDILESDYSELQKHLGLGT